MNISSIDDARQWFTQNRASYNALVDVVRGTLESLLKSSRIDFLSVSGRTKTIESFIEKIERKDYQDPEKEATDLAGVRVITFIERDAIQVCDMIRNSFQVHATKSLDKAEELDVDRFGYRSFHFVCDLGQDRIKLPELAPYKNLLFEIQVRTVLQHAWAEIEHDRNYKLAGVLPSSLKRRLYLIAGMLEMADREFNLLASEVDAYAETVAAATKKGDLQVELNSTSISEFLKTKLAHTRITFEQRPMLPQVIDELHDYGINNLSDLNKLFTDQLLASHEKHQPVTTDVGLLRKAMMFDDLQKYFSKSWKNHFSTLNPSTEAILQDKYEPAFIKKVISSHMKPRTRKKKST